MLELGLNRNIDLDDKTEYIFQFEGHFNLYGEILNIELSNEDFISIYEEIANAERIPLKVVKVLDTELDSDYIAFDTIETMLITAIFETTKPMTVNELTNVYQEAIHPDIDGLLDGGFTIIKICD